MRRTGTAIVSLLGAVIISALPAHADNALTQRIDAYLQPYLDIGHLSGTLLVADGDDVLYHRSFGLADHELGVANSLNTRFGVGSVNKPMTAVVMARLLDEEKLALDDRLSDYAPDFPRGDDITLQHLVTHSAGIAHQVTGELDETRPQTAASMLALAANKPLIYEPGSTSVYSSAGFSVLARVMEIASGESYAQLLERLVLRPPGMTETSDAGSRAIIKGRAKAYAFDTVGLLNAAPEDVSYLVGAGSVFSTPWDIHAMQRALLAGDYGERAAAFLLRDNGNLSWNGTAAGYRSFADYDADTGISVIMASNLISGALDRLRGALPAIVAGKDVPPAPALPTGSVAVDLAVLESYQGNYQLSPESSLTLRVENGRVMMDDWLLIPVAEDTLFSPQDYARITVISGEDGSVQRLDWKIGEDVYQMPRISP